MPDLKCYLMNFSIFANLFLLTIKIGTPSKKEKLGHNYLS